MRPRWPIKCGVASGFTLLEVLVALALLGTVFVAVGVGLEQQMRTQRQLEENLAAAQLGWNLMETFHIQGRPLSPEHLQGEEALAGWLFSWSRQILPMEQGHWYQVQIRVDSKGRPLYSERWSWPSP